MMAKVSDCCGGPLEVRGGVSPYFVCGTCGYPCEAVPERLSERYGPGEPIDDECDGAGC